MRALLLKVIATDVERRKPKTTYSFMVANHSKLLLNERREEFPLMGLCD